MTVVKSAGGEGTVDHVLVAYEKRSAVLTEMPLTARASPEGSATSPGRSRPVTRRPVVVQVPLLLRSSTRPLSEKPPTARISPVVSCTQDPCAWAIEVSAVHSGSTTTG